LLSDLQQSALSNSPLTESKITSDQVQHINKLLYLPVFCLLKLNINFTLSTLTRLFLIQNNVMKGMKSVPLQENV